MHLLNFVWPNVFEQSPHVINAVFEALNGMMVGLGPSRVFHYVLQVRFVLVWLRSLGFGGGGGIRYRY